MIGLVSDASPLPGEVNRSDVSLEFLFREALARLEDRGVSYALAFDDVAHAFGESLLVDIDPRQLEFKLANLLIVSGQRYSPADFFFGTGEWGVWLKPITKSRVYREGRQLVRHHHAFRQTASYKHKSGLIGSGKHITHNHVVLDSIEKLDDYFRNFRRMFKRAETVGIEIRTEPLGPDFSNVGTVNTARPIWAEISERNVGIAIGSGGEIYRVGPGQHRTVVAKLLGLPSIPCEVRLVHERWLRRMMDATGRSAEAALRQGLAEIRRGSGYGEK